MSEKDDDSTDETPLVDPNKIAFDLGLLSATNNEAMKNIMRITTDIPDMLKPLQGISLSSSAIGNAIENIKDFKITISPELSNLAEQMKDIHIVPSDLALNIDSITPFLISSPELITPIQKESEIISKQDEAIRLLEKIVENQDKGFKKQSSILDEIFKMVIELKEEQRLEHPFVDKVYQMAIEWGLESIDDEK